VSVSSLCIAASVPTTTALRTINQMVDTGLLARASDPNDARRSFIGLANRTADAMEACLDAALNQPGL
ncbi:MAG: winged helix DNA-binding protein, partial [Sandaracinobacteroides sp.]